MSAGGRWCIRVGRLLLFLAALSLPGLTQAQERVMTPSTPFPPPESPLSPALGVTPRAAPPDTCADLLNHPLLTLTLEPAVIYPDDSVTLRWEVRNRRPGLAWTQPVHLRRTFRIEPIIPDPAPASDSRTWIAQRSIRNGTFTVATLCGQKTVVYTLEQPPRIDWVTPDKGGLAQPVAIHGDDFGVRQQPKPPSEVRFSIEGGMFLLNVKSWTNRRIDVTLPSLPAGDGVIRISKAGRLLSLPAPFHSLGALTVPFQPITLGPSRVTPALPPQFAFTPAMNSGMYHTPTPTPARRR